MRSQSVNQSHLPLLQYLTKAYQTWAVGKVIQFGKTDPPVATTNPSFLPSLRCQWVAKSLLLGQVVQWIRPPLLPRASADHRYLELAKFLLETVCDQSKSPAEKGGRWKLTALFSDSQPENAF